MAESTSDRSSKIGHDVSDSVIISGDSNHITYSETQCSDCDYVIFVCKKSTYRESRLHFIVSHLTSLF